MIQYSFEINKSRSQWYFDELFFSFMCSIGALVHQFRNSMTLNSAQRDSVAPW